MFFVVLCTGAVMLVCGRVPWLYQYWPGWVYGFVVGASEGSTGSGSGFLSVSEDGATA